MISRLMDTLVLFLRILRKEILPTDRALPKNFTWGLLRSSEGGDGSDVSGVGGTFLAFQRSTERIFPAYIDLSVTVLTLTHQLRDDARS